MSYVYWEATSSSDRRAKVRHFDALDVPEEVTIVAAIGESDDLRGPALYKLLSVEGLGPVIAWVGVPGGRAQQGHFVHPASGKTWERGQLRHAVRFALDYRG